VIAQHVVVHGRVQGVGYRMAVASRARALGVAGWVRNRADGTVEAVFEGAPDAVESLVRWCADGPRGADVSRVDDDTVRPEGLTSFQIR
jgi:acylphosphatase